MTRQVWKGILLLAAPALLLGLFLWGQPAPLPVEQADSWAEISTFLNGCRAPIRGPLGEIVLGYIWGDLTPFEFRTMAEVAGIREEVAACVETYHHMET